MGSYKNIFGSLTNLAGDVVDKAKAGGKAIFKSADSKVIKTTSQTVGSSAKSVAGGRSVVKQSASKFAKGVGSTANVGGKAFGVTGILGGVSLAGAKIYDYVGDKWAVTTAQREYENQIKLAGQEADITKKAQDQQIDYMNKINDLRNSGASAGMGASGGAGFGDDLFPIGQSVEDSQGSKNYMWLALLGIAIVGGGTYIYSKKMKGGKK